MPNGKRQICRDIYESGKGINFISKETGIPRSTVYHYIKDISRKHKRLSKQQLENLYISKGLSIRKISEKTGHTSVSVNKWLKNYGIERRARGTNQHNQYTLESARKVFAENGHELLEERYANIKTPMKYKCRCGNISETSLAVILRGATCKACAVKRGAVKKKPNIEEVRDIFKERQCELLSTEYIDTHAHLEYICHCGAKAQITLSNFKAGYGCWNCKKLAFKGENNHNWNSELKEEDRQEAGRYEDDYRAWKREVKRRCGFQCVICGSSKSNYLRSHHLDGYAENKEKRTDVENGVCLCVDCHKEFHSLYGYGGNTKEQFEKFKTLKLKKEVI